VALRRFELPGRLKAAPTASRSATGPATTSDALPDQ